MRLSKADVGKVVKIPTYCWDEKHNQWYYCVAVVLNVGWIKTNGEQRVAAVVEFPKTYYGQTFRKHFGGEVECDVVSREVVRKTFLASKIIEYSAKERQRDQRFIQENKRENVRGGCYTNEIEFLIDRGFLVENK